MDHRKTQISQPDKTHVPSPSISTPTTKKLKLETFSVSNSTQPSPSTTLQEIKGDLFTSKTSLAHCISQDLNLGAGVARIFRNKYAPELIQELKKKDPQIGDACPFSTEGRTVYNLVTKKRFFDKPTYESLRSTLLSMKEHACSNDIKTISIPKIGCGLDKLKWEVVKEMIDDIFSMSGIKIIVYY